MSDFSHELVEVLTGSVCMVIGIFLSTATSRVPMTRRSRTALRLGFDAPLPLIAASFPLNNEIYSAWVPLAPLEAAPVSNTLDLSLWSSLSSKCADISDWNYHAETPWNYHAETPTGKLDVIAAEVRIACQAKCEGGGSVMKGCRRAHRCSYQEQGKRVQRQ